ncbi:unnamed protein product [Prunus armeniaca]|uniref:40S ribosomal protein S21 n=1 Tax=Prunus armeniaca TaxID=36596 RepID=A0A6J5XL46_PRUAR|nr:unnamed protein product [Prunus armeniaca]
MQNEEGVITELYIPRKCSATNRLITSKDHASVQINVGHLDENGIYTGQFSTFALCGYVRAQGVITELYIPRKCSATNRWITSKDHASFQINVGHLDENGIYTGQFSTFALCGYVRALGDADSGLDRLWQKKKAEVKRH